METVKARSIHLRQASFEVPSQTASDAAVVEILSPAFCGLCRRLRAEPMADGQFLNLRMSRDATCQDLSELFRQMPADMGLFIDLRTWRSADVERLARVLECAPVRSIWLKNIRHAYVEVMLASLPQALTTLHLDGGSWNDAATEVLHQIAARHPLLETLLVDATSISFDPGKPKGVRPLSHGNDQAETFVDSDDSTAVAQRCRFTEALCSVLHTASRLKQFSLAGWPTRRMERMEFLQVVRAFSGSKHLEALTLNVNLDYSRYIIDELALAVSCCESLKRLEVGHGSIDARRQAELAKLLQPQLERFSCTIASDGLAYSPAGLEWKTAILACANLRQFHLNWDDARDAPEQSTFGEIGAACARHGTLEEVRLGKMREVDFECFVAKFTRCRSVKRLHLDIERMLSARLNQFCISLFLDNDALTTVDLVEPATSATTRAWPPAVRHAMTLALPPREARVWMTMDIAEVADVIRQLAKDPNGVAHIRKMISPAFHAAVSAYFAGTGERDHPLPQDVTDHILAAIEPEAIFGFLNSLLRAHKASAQLLGEALYLRG